MATLKGVDEAAFAAGCRMLLSPDESQRCPPWRMVEEADALGRAHTLLVAADVPWFRPSTAAEQLPAVCGQGQGNAEDSDWGSSSSSEEESDALKAPRPPAEPHQQRPALTLRLTVDLSPSFRMPVCHFSCCDASGGPIADAFELQARYMPWLNVDGESTTSGALVTPTVHELTGRVMLFLHPCDVHSLAALFVPGQPNGGQTAGTTTAHQHQEEALRLIRFVIGFAASSLRMPLSALLP
jgi:hypothetical protein